MADNITPLYPELPRDRIDQIVFDMEEVVHEALYLSEILRDVFGNRHAASSKDAREYMAVLLQEKTARIHEEWHRAIDAMQPASNSAE